jgi:hypothetical protein
MIPNLINKLLFGEKNVLLMWKLTLGYGNNFINILGESCAWIYGSALHLL